MDGSKNVFQTHHLFLHYNHLDFSGFKNLFLHVKVKKKKTKQYKTATLDVVVNGVNQFAETVSPWKTKEQLLYIYELQQMCRSR